EHPGDLAAVEAALDAPAECGGRRAYLGGNIGGSLLGSMAVIEVPKRLAERFDRPEDLQKAILDLHSIELPVIDWGGRRFVRISAMVHNRPHQYERLAEAIRSMAT
ncbi:MAG: hypothetical protein ACO3ZY_13600, partial [Phycisphaerales bacterium]